MQKFLIGFLGKYGYIGVFILIFIENLFPPIPSEIILTFGGYLTTCTRLSIMGTTIFATLGSVFGAIVLYGLGYALSGDALNRLINGKIGKALKFNVNNVEEAKKSFNEKGNNAVFFCRFIPIVRSIISIPAGMTKMNPVRFLVLTILGSFAWNIVLISFGAFAGNAWMQAAKYIKGYSEVIKVVVVLLIIFLAIKKAGKGT